MGGSYIDEDGYFDGLWWQDEVKLREVAAVIRSELLSTGPYQLNTNLGFKDSPGDSLEINKRMYAIQALANVARTGYYDEPTLAGIETQMSLYGMDFSDHVLDEKKLDILIERYGIIRFKKSGNVLETGWGDVLEGAMLLGAGYAYSRNISAKNINSKDIKVKKPAKVKKVESSSFADMMTPEEVARYSNYWNQGTGSYQGIKVDGKSKIVIVDGKNINTRQRMYTTPGTRSIIDVKLGSKGKMYYRETIFDEYGRKIGHIDYTDHGRPDVSSHTNQHYHPNPVNNPSQHGEGVPGLHPQKP